ncbi:alpha/beta fold hydrolase [Methylobacterium sp. WSM2598]|uniref:alpha/beta fold hydrolase n=1 Tax=Methylobacterium sp. WSM2598 TaxID=398261 RepID=UPI00037DB669|nr:alpha/beta hydrolase [Methylobacterium sp. WSM2598]
MRRLLHALALGSMMLAASPVLAREAGSVTQTMVERDGVKIEALSQGTGPTIVILPSLGRSGEDYDVVSRMLAEDGFRVLRPQPRGIGRSEGPMEGLNMHDLAADVASVIEHEKAAPAVVVGHAFGNFVARQIAADQPDLVKGVVVAAASAGKVPPGSTEKPIGPEMRKAIDGPSDPSLPEKKRLEYLRIAFFAPGNDPRVWLGGWNTAVHHMESHARNHTPVDDYFAAGRAPILDLQAEHDPVAPRRFAGVLKSLLGDRVTIVVIPNAGHALVPEQPVAVAREIAKFARGLDGK